MVDDVLWEKGHWHFHILIPVKGCFEVHIFDVIASKTGPFGADDAVSKGFQRDHVSGKSGEFKRVVDKITSNSDPDPIGVFLLGAITNDNPGICQGPVFGDLSDLMVGEEKYGIGSFGNAQFSPDKMM